MATPSHPRPPVAPAALNRDASAMWTNLGDWSEATDYGEAAEALALRVGRAAQLRADDVVVDYACGYGDSLRLWVERFGVRRVVGVEPSAEVCAVVRDRITAWGLAERIRIVQSRAEALPPRAAHPDVSAAVCVDAAYHFQTRRLWWAMLAANLPRAARIAATDLVLADGQSAGAALRLAAALMRIPAANLVTATALRTQLSALGLRELRSESLSEVVLDGFARHVRSSGVGVAITRATIRALRRRPAVEYLLLAAPSGARP